MKRKLINNNGISSIIILAIIASVLTIFLGALAFIALPKVIENKSASDKANSDISYDKDIDNKESEPVVEVESDDSEDEEDDIPSKKPVLIDDTHYTLLGETLSVMIENEIITSENTTLTKDCKTLLEFLEISDRVTGLGWYVADKEDCPKPCLTYHYFSKDTLKRFSYSLFGTDLGIDNLQDMLNLYDEKIIEKNEFAEDGYAFVKDDYLVLAVGEAGYMGPEPDYFRTEYLGKGQWKIIATVTEEDYSSDYYDSSIVPLIIRGTLVVTVEEDDASLLDGYRIIDASWEDAWAPEYTKDWQKSYYDLIQSSYTEYDGFSSDVEKTYSFIYFNDDDIPDLVINKLGYNVSVYCYDGKEAQLMFAGGYGAAGINSYDYVEKESIVEWSDIDFAGLEIYFNAARFYNENRSESILDHGLCIKNYIDTNENGMPDEDEMNYAMDSDEEIAIYYVDNKEVSQKEFNSYMKKIPTTDGELTDVGLDYWNILSELFTIGEIE